MLRRILLPSFLLVLSFSIGSSSLSYSQWNANSLPLQALSEHFLHRTDFNKDGTSEVFLRTSLTRVEGFYGPRQDLNGSNLTEVVLMYEDFGCTTVTGDFNGDNYTDLAIGACTASNYGAVIVYFGNSTGFPANYSLVVPHPDAAPGSNFGFCMAVGRVNNDTLDDIVITDYQYNNSSGKLWLFYGNSSGFLSVPAFTYNAHFLAGSQFGSECNIIDLDGDSRQDLIIGAPSYSNGQSQEGAVLIFYNLNGNFSQRMDVLEPNISNAFLGGTVETCDVNGDGYGDLLLGVPTLGKVGVYFGSSLGIVIGITMIQTLRGTDMPDYSSAFGHEISCLGTLNNDTTQEVLIGAHNASYLFVASSTGLIEPPEGYIPGYVLEFIGAGDISGDGFGDIVMVFNGTVNYTLALLTNFQNISMPPGGGTPFPSATPTTSATPTPSVTPSTTPTASSTPSPTSSASVTPSGTVTPTASLASGGGRSGGLTKAEAAATGAATGSSCMIIVVAGIIWYRRRKKHEDSDTDSELEEELEDPNHMVAMSESSQSSVDSK